MSRHDVVGLVLEPAEHHPAIRAWRQLATGNRRPLSIEVLKAPKRKSAVYRLVGTGPAGLSLIAKSAEPERLRREADLYQRVLSHLPLQMLEVYGLIESDGEWWLFLEDAGDVWYSPDIAMHWRGAVDWLGRLYTSPLPREHGLPDAGPAHFSEVLTRAYDGITGARSHHAVSASDVAVLDNILRFLDDAATSWAAVTRACEGVPGGLVHGDFVPKNVRITTRGGRPGIVAFDWETAGVGPPAADLAMLPGGEDEVLLYHALVTKAWPEITPAVVRRLRVVGQLFRLLHCVEWELRSFTHPWIDRAMRRLEIYRDELERTRHLGKGIW